MGFGLRNKSRYGKYSATSDEIGKCILQISISGWTDEITVYQNGKIVGQGELGIDDDDEDGDVFEDDTGFYLWCSGKGNVKINKPLGKCLKRFN